MTYSYLEVDWNEQGWQEQEQSKVSSMTDATAIAAAACCIVFCCTFLLILPIQVLRGGEQQRQLLLCTLVHPSLILASADLAG